MWDGWLSGNDHGLQIAVNRRFSQGLLLKGAYTFRNRAVSAAQGRPHHMFTLGFVIGEIGANKSWFDPLAFRQPAGVRFGTTGRNTLYGPGKWNVDFSLFCNFRLSERF